MPPSDSCFPKNITDEAINELLVSLELPKATNIVVPKVDASFHAIYMITLPPGREAVHGRLPFVYNELVLRVAAGYWPNIKSDNEFGVMTYVSRNTNIPIPEYIAHDSSSENSLGYEFSLLARVPGETLCDIWEELDDKSMDSILDQLADILVVLHSSKWDKIGGLKFYDDGLCEVTRVMDETFWTAQQTSLWPAGETIDSLNIGGPFDTYTDYISAEITLYIRLIRLHENLKFYRQQAYALEALLAALKEHAEELNKTMFILAHKDLHFGNVMYDRESGKITGILDWEFSGVVPAPKWNPRKAFLWNCDNSGESKVVKERLTKRFAQRCEERGVKPFPKEVEFTSPRQRAMQEIADHVRAIIEVKVRDQYSGTTQMRAQTDKRVKEWGKTVSKALKVFGI